MPVRELELRERTTMDSDACWEVLQRVVTSPQLRRAARMREFLQFVGERSLKDGCDQIHEQEIGAEVFGRQVGYDTSVDNIVRVNATDLRKRIEDYFATDGAGELLVFEIPRGSYKPVFRYRAIQVAPGTKPVEDIATPVSLREEVAAPKEEVAAPVGVSESSGRSPVIWLFGVAGIVIAALAIGCVVLWMQNRSLQRPHYASRDTPELASFWAGFLAARPNTDVILADTSFSLIEDITKRPIPLDEYLNHGYISQIQSPALSQDRRDDLGLIVERSYGSLGDFRVAQRIVALDPQTKNLHLYYARDYTPPLIRQDNVILIGSRKSNPWVDLFAGKLNFTIEYDPEKKLSYVLNHSPASGEKATYVAPPAPDTTTGYCVVAYLPNPDQTGRVLILAGTGGESTEGAGEFLTSEAALASFRQLLHVKTLPYFEVVLRATHLNSTPMSADVVAYRVYPGN